MDCEFIVWESDEVETDGTIGLFTSEDDMEECPRNLVIGDFDDDTMLKTSRSMISLSLISAMIAAALVSFEFFCCKVCCAVMLENITYLVAVVTGALVYIAYANELCTGNPKDFATDLEFVDVVMGKDDASVLYDCSFGKGSTYNLCAIVFYLAASIVLCCSPKPTPLLHQCRK